MVWLQQLISAWTCNLILSIEAKEVCLIAQLQNIQLVATCKFPLANGSEIIQKILIQICQLGLGKQKSKLNNEQVPHELPTIAKNWCTCPYTWESQHFCSRFFICNTTQNYIWNQITMVKMGFPKFCVNSKNKNDCFKKERRKFWFFKLEIFSHKIYDTEFKHFNVKISMSLNREAETSLIFWIAKFNTLIMVEKSNVLV